MKGDWTTERDGQLRALWSEGLAAAEIGRRMGVTKNAVIGRAARLKLARRASPILPPREPPAVPATGACRWPLWGNDERPTQEFCGAPRAGLGPYCDRHADVAYVRQPTTASERLKARWRAAQAAGRTRLMRA